MSDVQSMRIERARKADVPALIELLAALFAIESDFSADRVRQRRGLELLLAQPEDRAVLPVARPNDGVAVGLAPFAARSLTFPGWCTPPALFELPKKTGARRRPTNGK